ncbi:TIGR03643 family protein [Alkalicoccus halolimnae]|uniref:TIGR03643 family protein n=1 Tax=Alkalicoccus halolimnae TaxID=1667239 RepID=A0A5C7F4V3_9BACI|nr:TIGR03643 family protein [Alkalicoccus halolimnae]TXF83311.1 TIGR03643 family protein [Alkalicoccus halolimnae]
MKATEHLTVEDIDRIVEMAWEDRTPFDLIEVQFSLKEKDVIKLMRREMKESSFRMWRKRVNNRRTKHAALRSKEVRRFRSPDQKPVSY